MAVVAKVSVGNVPISFAATTTVPDETVLEPAAAASNAAVLALNPVVAGMVTLSPAVALTLVFCRTKFTPDTVGVLEHAVALWSVAPDMLSTAVLNKP